MKLHLPLPLLRALAALLFSSSPAMAGLMAHTIDLQLYRDFAENKGIFAAGATDVAIYGKDGNYIGTISRIANFDALPDAHTGGDSLAGGPAFAVTVQHEGYFSVVTFTQRFGATEDTPFYDSYKSIMAKQGSGDFRIHRLNKIVTEVDIPDYCTDTSILNNIKGTQVQRVGTGRQCIATDNGKQYEVDRAYYFPTGGTAVISGQSHTNPAEDVTPNYASPGTYPSYSFSYSFTRPSEANPLPMGLQPGDSGSLTYVFNENTGKWEYLSAGRAIGGGGYGENNYTYSEGIWATAYIESLGRTVTVKENGGAILWGVTNNSGDGNLTQGEDVTAYKGLESGLRGDTSTLGNRASDSLLAACNNLVFDGAAGRIVLQGSIDTGAGYLTFNNDYVLSNGDQTGYRLNTAGFVVSEGAAVTTELTGAEGDEWRKIGEGALIIGGSGNNVADLNVGGSGLLILNREGGYAARNIKINGGNAAVRLTGWADVEGKQWSGDILFGHRGGTVDLYGGELTIDHVTNLDEGATFSNQKENTEARLTYQAQGVETYNGSFTDGSETALLQVIYDGQGEDARLVLTGTDTDLKNGRLTIRSGEVEMRGTLTVHADQYFKTSNYEVPLKETYSDPDDWHYAQARMNVEVESGTQFALKDHARLDGTVTVKNGGVFRLEPTVMKKWEHVEGQVWAWTDMESEKARELYGLKGNVHLEQGGLMEAAMGNEEGISQVYDGSLSGTGTFIKHGTGVLLTLGGDNTQFAGVKQIREGELRFTGINALGDCSVNKWEVQEAGVISVESATNAATAQSVLERVNGSSKGVFALDGSQVCSADGTAGTLDAQLDFSKTASLSLGALEGTELSYGNEGTNEALRAVNGSWYLGGGGGKLTVNYLLTGFNDLYVGGESKNGTGIVVLANENNDFMGNLILAEGVSLSYTKISALGQGRFNLHYGSLLELNSPGDSRSILENHLNPDASGVLGLRGDVVDNIDLGASQAVFLGASGEAAVSGELAMGGNDYRLGGTGLLSVERELSGSQGLTVDGQGYSGGIISLNKAASLTGDVIVRGHRDPGSGGNITLRAGEDNLIGSAASVTLGAGGRLDGNGHDMTLNNLTLEAGSALVNTAETETVFTFNLTGDSDFKTTTEGLLRLEKTDGYNLTLGAELGSRTTLAASAGNIMIAEGVKLSAGTVELSGSAFMSLENGVMEKNAGVVLSHGGTLELKKETTSKWGNESAFQYGNVRVGEGKGVIQMNDANRKASLTRGIQVDEGGTLVKEGAGALQLESHLSGKGDVLIREGSLSLSPAYGTGEVTFRIQREGTLKIETSSSSGSNTLHSANNFFLEDGSTLFLGSGTHTFRGDMTLESGTFTCKEFGIGYLDGTISGDGRLKVSTYMGPGSNQLVALSGNNTYSGGTEITLGGALYVRSAGALSTGDVLLDSRSTENFEDAFTGETYSFGGTSTLGWMTNDSGISRQATLTFLGAGNLDTRGNHVLLDCFLESADTTSGFTKKGAGTLELAGDADGFTATAVIESGTLKNGTVNALGNGSLIVKRNAILEVNGQFEITGETTFENGSIMKADANSFLNLKGENTTGNMTVSFETLDYSGPSEVHLIHSDQGGLTESITLEGAEGLVGSRINAVLNVLNEGQDLYLNINGNRTTVTWRGSTAEGSVFSMGNADSVHITTELGVDDHTMYSLDKLAFDQESAKGGAAHAVVLGEEGLRATELLVRGDDHYTFSGGALSGETGLVKTGKGTLTLTAANTYTGGTSLESGTIVADGVAVFGTGPVRAGQNTVLELAQDTALGNVELQMVGVALKTSASGLDEARSVKFEGISSLTFMSGNSFTKQIQITEGSTLTMDSGENNLTWNAAVSGSGTLVKTGSGSLSLYSKFNRSQGDIIIREGTLNLGHYKGETPSLGSGRLRMEANTILSLNSGMVTHANQMEFGDGATLKALDGANYSSLSSPNYQFSGKTLLDGLLNIELQHDKVTVFSGVIADSEGKTGSFNIKRLSGGTGAAQIVLKGENTFSGGIVMSGNTRLVVNNSKALGTGTLKLNNGELAWLDYTGGFDAEVVMGGGTLRVDAAASGDVTMDSRISGTKLTKTGGGRLIVSGELELSGGAAVNGGELVIDRRETTQLNGDVSTGSSSSSNGTLSFRSNAVISNGGLGGYGNIHIDQGVYVTLNSATTNKAPGQDARRYYGSEITGGGTLELTRNVLAFYAATTQVDPALRLSGGTLSLNGAATLTQGLQVAANAEVHFLSSTGSINANVDVLHGASLALTGVNNASATATFTGGSLHYGDRTETKFKLSNGSGLVLDGSFLIDLSQLQFDEGMLASSTENSSLALTVLAQDSSPESFYGRNVSFNLNLAQGLGDESSWDLASLDLDENAPNWLGNASLSGVQFQDGTAFLTITGQIVPEPSTASITLAAVALALFRRHRRDER